ncbi:MAG: polysaccharide biosynthesis protein [Polyangiaceae bacterium]|nr:polysaccharide biosynthesis protein [Polyangiaceae bacterium]
MGEFLADNAIVSIALLIGKLRGIVTLPLIVGAIGTAGYGTWAQILAFTTLLSVIISWNLHLPLIRFIAADRSKAPNVYTSILVLEMMMTVLSAAALLPFSKQASALLLGDTGLERHLAVSLVLVFFSNVRLMNLNVYRAYNRFLARSVVEVSAQTLELGVILVVFAVTKNLLYALIAMAAWAAIVAAVSTWHASRLTGFAKPDRATMRRAMAYAVPLLPSLLSFWILDRSDRFLIGRFLGPTEVGIYSASYALGGLVLQAQAPFQMTLFPKVAQLWDTDRATAKRYIELSNKFFLTLAIPFTAACGVVAPALLDKLGNAEIAAQSAILTVLISAGVSLWGVTITQSQILHGARSTGIQGMTSLVAAAVNVVINVVLLPRIGVVGAAVATLAAYGLQCFVLARAARKHLLILYYPVYLAKCLFASFVMLVPMSLLIAKNVWAIAAAVVTGAITYFVMLIAVRAFDAEERAFAVRGLNKVLRRTGVHKNAGSGTSQ